MFVMQGGYPDLVQDIPQGHNPLMQSACLIKCLGMKNPINKGCKANEHYNIAETAELLGVTRPTIYRFIKDGLISPKHHSRLKSNRVKGADIIKFYNSIYN